MHTGVTGSRNLHGPYYYYYIIINRKREEQNRPSKCGVIGGCGKIRWTERTEYSTIRKGFTEKIIVDKCKEKTKRIDGSHTRIQRVAMSNFRRDGKWKEPPKKTTVTIHGSDYRTPKI